METFFYEETYIMEYPRTQINSSFYVVTNAYLIGLQTQKFEIFLFIWEFTYFVCFVSYLTLDPTKLRGEDTILHTTTCSKLPKFHVNSSL